MQPRTYDSSSNFLANMQMSKFWFRKINFLVLVHETPL